MPTTSPSGLAAYLEPDVLAALCKDAAKSGCGLVALVNYYCQLGLAVERGQMEWPLQRPQRRSSGGLAALMSYLDEERHRSRG